MILFLLNLCLFFPSVVLSKDYFTAAVFEHRSRTENDHENTLHQTIENNLNFYEKAVLLASQQGADLILFNEYGLLPYPRTRENFLKIAENIPHPSAGKLNPCIENSKDRPTLTKLSCLARNNNIYVVANLPDVQLCEGICDASKIESCDVRCPEDNAFFYNTNVAFDREGNLVARYHKVHPYFEMVNIPEEPEFITFDTDFGKFGLIICFDSVFQESVQLAKDHKIDTMLFPTFWFDDIVPLNAVEWQQSWAFANGVNFIASNTHKPGNASLGSGIYSKDDGALVYTYEPDGQSKLLVANVRIKGSAPIPEKSSITIVSEKGAFPKTETGEKFPDVGYEKIVGPAVDEYMDYRYVTSQTENYTKVKLENHYGKLEACHNGFCCHLSYSAKDMKEDFYLVAFNGLNNVRNYYEWWEENCFLLRCDAFGNEPCVIQPPRSKTVFKKVELSAKFSTDRIYPSVSNTNFRLAPKKEYSFKTKGQMTKLKFESSSNEPLLKVALLGRVYSRDPPYVPFFKF